MFDILSNILYIRANDLPTVIYAVVLYQYDEVNAYSQTTLLFIQDSKKLEITHRLSRSTILYAYV